MAKKILIIAGLVLFGASVVFAAPYYRTDTTILPITDSEYDLGTTSQAWRNVYTDQICITGQSCTSSFGGGSGGGTWSTTTSTVSGQLFNYPNNNTDIVVIGSNSTTTGEFWFDPNANKFVTLTGNVGIGTTSPYKKLSVTDGGYSILIGGSGLSTGSNIYSDTTMHFGTLANNSLNIYTNGTNRLAIKNTGEVGIGTTTPYSKLTVSEAGSAILTLERVDSSISANDAVGKIQFYADDASTATNFIVADIEAQAVNTIGTDINPGRLIFRTTPDGVGATPVERMRITSTGLVGIGTTSPAEILHVSSTTANGASIRIDNTAAASGRIYDINPFISGVSNSGFELRDETVSGGIPLISISSTANVGIGSSSPYTKLGVSGQVVASNFIGTTTATSTFGGAVGVGTTSPQFPLSIRGGQGQDLGISGDAQATVEIVNPTDSDNWLRLQTGATGDYRNYIAWMKYNGSAWNWLMGHNRENDFILYDARYGSHRLQAVEDGNTHIASVGTGSIILNNPISSEVNTGTGGLKIYSGGASPSLNHTLDSTGATFSTSETVTPLSGEGQVVIDNSSAVAGNVSALYFQSNEGSTAKRSQISSGLDTSGVGGFLTFATRQTGGDFGEALRINTLQNVGVGTTSPIARLDVAGGNSSTLNLLNLSSVTSWATTTRFSVGYQGTTLISGSTTVGSLVTPISRLQVDDTSNSKILIKTNSDAVNETSSLSFAVTSGAGVGGFSSRSADIKVTRVTGNYMDFGVYSSDATNNNLRMIIKGQTGNTGIATSSPYSKLSVWGSGTGTDRIFELTNSASTTLASFLENGTGYLLGNIGIGTTSPYAKLSVVGETVASHFTATTSTASTFPYASTTMISATTASSSKYFGGNLVDCDDPTNSKLLWSDTGVFSCGSDQTGAGGTIDGAGSAGMMASWTDGNTVQATSTIVGAVFHATSTTATSTTPRLSISTGISILGEYFENFTNYVRSLFTGGTGITLSSGDISFDCSEVEGTGIDCTGEAITLNATGDWTGTVDGNNFAGGAVTTGDLLYGSSAGAISELGIGTNGYVLGVSGGLPTWLATTSIPLAGDVTGTLSASVVGDDSHAHTGATISGLDISSDTNLTAGDNLTLTDDDIDLDATLAGLTGITSTGAIDLGGAVLEIPNGASPTANDVGELAHDTTSNQLILDDYVVGMAEVPIWAPRISSTSVAFIGGDLMPLSPMPFGFTITGISCYVYGGTSKIIAIEHADTSSTEDITCGTTVTSDDGSITNATFTANEIAFIDFGATSGAVNYVSITVSGTKTRE